MAKMEDMGGGGGGGGTPWGAIIGAFSQMAGKSQDLEGQNVAKENQAFFRQGSWQGHQQNQTDIFIFLGLLILIVVLIIFLK